MWHALAVEIAIFPRQPGRSFRLGDFVFRLVWTKGRDEDSGTVMVFVLLQDDDNNVYTNFSATSTLL